MNTNKEVWLDLEGTIIDIWENMNIFLPHRVKNYLDDHKIAKVNIFSFALWTNADQEKFYSSGLKEQIESITECEIINVPNLPQIWRQCSKWDKIKYDDIHEFAQINGKWLAFIKYIQADPNNQNKTCVLIDDMVEDSEFIIKPRNLKIELIDVKNLF